jgi:hypothetical protein
MQQQGSPEIDFREFFWVVRFSTFATKSANNGLSVTSVVAGADG